ncbi:hypothetical protein AB0I77_45795 [Streptomyces sp. NPDC050619]|uniref:hypothetical protein n=1 Tax=Streptomyces sp. NPDC050619 TaxID=3157214 RepID=UPI003425F2E3
MQHLSPWEFCQFLGDLVVAGARAGKAQDRYFCEPATHIDTAARAAASVSTDCVEPEPGPEKVIAPDAYEKALTKAEKFGYKNVEDAGLMAGFCETPCRSRWARCRRSRCGRAQRRGMTAKELCRLAGKDPLGVSELWCTPAATTARVIDESDRGPLPSQ